MASAKEIKERMGGVRETRQITNAMYLVASTKLRHAREDLDKTRPYFNALRSEFSRVFRADEKTISRWFYDPDGTEPDGGVRGILAITGDKGLAGAYNMNILRKTEALLAERPNPRLFVIGEYGRRYFMGRHVPFEEDFHYSAQVASLDQAREICTRLVERYENRELDEILVVYTDMKSSLSATVQVHRLLPLARGDIFRPGDEAAETPPDFEFIPSQEAVLNTVIYSYITGFIYSATVDSLCSEQNARVTAMDAAGRNADKLLSELSLQLNRERQAAITQEITEISAGAKALKRGRKEEENAAWQTQA